MEHIWITINDLGVFLVMILVGALVWIILAFYLKYLRALDWLKVFLLLALSVGVVVINQYLLS